MSKPNSAMGHSRDFGMPAAPGKGDSDHTTDREAFNSGMDEVKFDGVSGLKKVGLKLVKVYGPSRKPALPPDDDTKWQHIPDNTPRRDEVVDRLNLGGQVVNDIPITNDIIRE